MNTKDKGNYAVGLAIAYFTKQLATILVPLNDSQEYDLVIDDGTLRKVQVKFTNSKNPAGNYQISLRSISGSSRKEYANVTTSGVDLLFVVTNDSDILLLPIEDVVNRSSISITKELLDKYKVKDFSVLAKLI